MGLIQLLPERDGLVLEVTLVLVQASLLIVDERLLVIHIGLVDLMLTIINALDVITVLFEAAFEAL